MDVPEVLDFEKKKLFVNVSWTTSPNPMLHEFLKFGVFSCRDSVIHRT